MPGWALVRRSMYTRPPRTLKAPVGVWFSCLTHTLHPIRLRSLGHAYCGVGAITRYTRPAARSSSSSVIVIGCSLMIERTGIILTECRLAPPDTRIALRSLLYRSGSCTVFDPD